MMGCQNKLSLQDTTVCCVTCNACHIHSVARVLQPPYKVGLDNPKKTILVEVMKATAAIGVVEDYKLLGKLNLRELSMIGDDSDKQGDNVSDATEQLEPKANASAAAEGQKPADSAD